MRSAQMKPAKFNSIRRRGTPPTCTIVESLPARRSGKCNVLARSSRHDLHVYRVYWGTPSPKRSSRRNSRMCTIVFSRSYKFGFIIMRFLMRLDMVREGERECFQLLALAVDAIHLERSRSVANDFLKRCPTHARKSVRLKLSRMNMNSLEGEGRTWVSVCDKFQTLFVLFFYSNYFDEWTRERESSNKNVLAICVI